MIYNNQTPLRPWFTMAFLLFILFATFPLFSQDNEAVEKGVIRIKVTDQFVQQLEQTRMARTSSNVMVTGIKWLDNLSKQYQVTSIKRVFRHGGKFEEKHRRYGLHLWYELRLDKNISVQSAISSYRGIPQIETVEAIHKKIIIGSTEKNFGPVIADPEKMAGVTLPGSSNDPMLPQQWHYNNTGQTSGTSGADIKLLQAWNTETGKSNVIVAITDGGVQINHPDLGANIWVNSAEIPGNAVDDDNNGYIDDINGYSFVDDSAHIAPDDHGTHVAGTIAAVSNNGIGVAGVAGGSGTGDGARIMSCAVFSGNGAAGFPESYIYGADNGAVISQNSWGYWYSGVYEQSVLDAIDYFIAEAGRDENGNQTGPMNGGLVIFAAGNADSQSNYFPGYYSHTLAVAGTTHQDKKAWYSNYGSWVDIAAPGGETEEVLETGVLSTLSNGQYGFYQGTSMACPHVSGVAALILSKFGGAGITPNALRNQLINTTDNIDAVNPQFAGKLGRGRLNAANALEDDTTAPSAITDLTVIDADITAITLQWTAPNDGGNMFTSSYDLRYSTAPITAGNFETAAPIIVPDPMPSDSTETFTVTGLSPATLYYFAIRAKDFQGNTAPLSNVVSQATDFAPVLVVNPDSIVENLFTAETSVRNITISNIGQGTLEFSFVVDKDDFAKPSPVSAVVPPGDSVTIAVSFDAHNKEEGMHEQDLVLKTNDPENLSYVIPVILNVIANQAPIAVVEPDTVNFKAVQTGTSLSKSVTIHNEGSEPLELSQLLSNNDDFTVDTTGVLTIESFQSLNVSITFSPQSFGFSTGELSIYTNDPDDSVIVVHLKGEGLSLPPITTLPDSIHAEAAKGSTTSRTLTVHNNGSEDRTYSIVINTKGVIVPPPPPNPWPEPEEGRVRTQTEQTVTQAEKRTPAQINTLLKAIRSQERTATTGRVQQLGTETGLNYYFTDFEDFNIGSVDAQGQWYGENGYVVATENPDSGVKHFRATSDGNGGEFYAISPPVIDIWSEEPHYITTTTMRVNADNARGTTYQIIPEGGYVVTRLRFNADGTMDALTGGYDGIWAPVNATIPTGYFDLAITTDTRGNDTTSFAVYDIFINNEKVFFGYGIGMGVQDVAFQCNNEQAGTTLEIDDLKIYEGEFIPTYITATPAAGVVPAGQSIDIDLEFDASAMNFGTYESDVIVRLDESLVVTVPTSFEVTGSPLIRIDPEHGQYYAPPYGYPDIIQGSMQISNGGGSTLTFSLEEDIPWLGLNPLSDTVPVRGSVYIQVPVNIEGMAPGEYLDSIKIVSNDPVRPVIYYEIRLNIKAPKISVEPTSFTLELEEGKLKKDTLLIRNTGGVYLTYQFVDVPAWITVTPSSGNTYGGEYIYVTFDSRNLSPGIYHDTLKISSNDPVNPILGVPVLLTVKAKPQEVLSFSLINTKTGAVVADFTDGITLNLAYNSLQDLNIRANTNPAIVGSVKFRINGSQANIDNYSPYTLKTGMFAGFTEGTYTLFAETWTEFGGHGKRGLNLSAKITILNTTVHTVSYFSLVNVWTGQVIRNFDEHVTLDIADPNYYSYQVFAYTIPETVGSLKFRIDGLQRNIDNDAPYKLQNYALHSYTSGTHTLGAVPYTEPKGHGTRGLENTATFTIIDSRVSGSAVARENASPEAEEISLEEEHDAFSVYPVPVNDELTIEFVPATDEAVELTIINVHGQPVYHVPVTAAQIRGYRVSTNAIGLTTGAYYVIIQTSQLRKTKKFMKQ